MKVKTDWWVNRAQAVEKKNFTEQYTVIKPFEQKQVMVGKENVDVQPFAPYLRRLTPANGAQPVYGHQLPVVTYTCNYMNAMLKEGKRRLAMILFDSDNEPCRYTRVIIETDDLTYAVADDLTELTRNFGFQEYIDLAAVKEKVPQDIPGIDPKDLEEAIVKALPGGKGLPDVDASQAGEGIPLRLYAAPASELLNEARMLRVSRMSGANGEEADRASTLENKLRARFQEADDRAVILAYEGAIKVLRLRFVTGIVEYRYTNDDLKLDVASLQLADCLSGGSQELNAYERGYFAPVIPKNASWNGPKANTRYTARIYALDENEKIDNQLPSGPALHSVTFTTSIFKDSAALAKAFTRPKTRQFVSSKTVYGNVIKALTAGLSPAPFDHPADSQWATFDLGLDIYRELAKQPVLNPAKGVIVRDMEEKYQKLYDKGSKAVTAARKAEGLVFEELFKDMNLKLDPLPTKGIRVTWLKTNEGASQQFGTLGLLVEFPEPVDWQRTGIDVTTFKAKMAADNSTVDLLSLPAASQYGIDLNWVRSLDGARLLLIPKLTRTRTYQPSVILSGSEPSLADRLDLLRAGASASLAEAVEAMESAAAVSPLEIEGVDVAAAGDELETNDGSGDSAEESTAVPRASFIGDVSIAAPASIDDTAEIVRIIDTFGTLIVENISNYQVSDLQLKFYYLGDNYEKKKAQNINFRAIPRLTYWKGAPGDARGYIGTLKVVSASA